MDMVVHTGVGRGTLDRLTITVDTESIMEDAMMIVILIDKATVIHIRKMRITNVVALLPNINKVNHPIHRGIIF
jgi:hypothetical protein